VRIAVGPASPVPFRARATEGFLLGNSLDQATLQAAGEVLIGEARFRTSPQRATAAYRQRMARVLLEEVLLAAWARAERQ
jgi:CO/xanthine dehydrogenase FAD-binding subunit